MSEGVVYLVGAGPGDPGLITVRGRQLLAEADVVVHDRLGTEALLANLRSDAERIDAGKQPGRAAMTQAETNATLIAQARRGRMVVRLKGGDPFVFGRGGEEAQALRAAGVRFEVVPGVTSAVAAPAYAGIPVTHRGLATAVTVVTGHEDPGKPAEQTNWAALARTPGTLVLMMAMGRLAEIAAALIAGGRPADQPAAAVAWGTTPRQHAVVGTLADLADRARQAGVGAPAVVVVGEVAGLAGEIAWRPQPPLAGRRVVVTRARAQASELSAALRGLGAEVVELPVIRVEPILDDPEINRILGRIGGYELLVLTSVNGVDALFARLAERDRDARALDAACTVVAIGPATAARLAAHGVRPDVVPERYVAEGILEALADRSLTGRRVLVARAREARGTLVEGLRARGAEVDELALYDTVAEPASGAALQAALEADYLTFTASSTVRRFVDLLGDDARPHGPRVVSIGPVTSATLREEGFTVHSEAREHTIPGLVAALLADAAR